MNSLAHHSNWLEKDSDLSQGRWLTIDEAPFFADADRVWHQLNKGDMIAPRSKYTLRNCRKFVRNLSYLEIIFENNLAVDLHVKLMGSQLENTYGKISNKRLSELTPDIFQRSLKIIQETIKKRQPVIRYSEHFSEEKEYLQHYVWAAPVSSDGNKIDGILTQVHTTY